MRLIEFTNAQQQLELWKLISDNVWQALRTQNELQQRQRAAQARKPKPKRKAPSARKAAPMRKAPALPAPQPAAPTASPTAPPTAPWPRLPKKPVPPVGSAYAQDTINQAQTQV